MWLQETPCLSFLRPQKERVETLEMARIPIGGMKKNGATTDGDTFNAIHPQSLTWNLKMMVSKRILLFQGLIFRFHVKLQGYTNLLKQKNYSCWLKTWDNVPRI